MSQLAYVLVFSTIGSVVSLVGGVVLLLRKQLSAAWLDALAAFAAGTLLSAAFVDLLPDAIRIGGGTAPVWALVGSLAFFAVERLVLVVHARHTHASYAASTPLIIVGGTLHNFIDGIVIGGTFLAGTQVGIVTSLAIAAHEVPQEIGDFAVLLHNGMRRRAVLAVNLISATVTIVGAVLTWEAGQFLQPALPAFIAVTAGMFIYIAAVDLIPEMLHHTLGRSAVVNFGALVAGVGAVAALA